MKRAGEAGTTVSGKIVAAFTTDGPLLDHGTLAIDGNNDLIGAFTGPKSHSIGVICYVDEETRGFRYLAELNGAETVEISGSDAANGFLLAFHGLSHSARYEVLHLSPSKHGFLDRKCSETSATIADADVAFESSASRFETQQYYATSSDGTKIPYYVLTPKGSSPKHLLIDVYGAFGTIRDFPYHSQSTRDRLLADGIAVAFPIVRGDGNLGYDFAVASRTPSRQKAVEDVVAVAQDVAGHFPDLKEKPAVRGMSAGAWLAVKSALARPDLFSGAIGYSGPYLFKDDPHQVVVSGGGRFFSENDDLSKDVASLASICPKLHFRFLHAKDDLKVPYNQAQRFHETVKSYGCPTEFISFETGGHEISIPVDNQQDEKRRREAYFSPF